MKQITPICLAFTVTLLASIHIQAEIRKHPSKQHFGLDASLRYFEDTLLETSALIEKTHKLLDAVEVNTPSKGTPGYALCKLCGNYERLLAHIDNLIEGRLYAVLPMSNWTDAISEDLRRMRCFTLNVIQHLEISQGYAEPTDYKTYAISGMDVKPSFYEWLDAQSNTRESLWLLEVSITLFMFHIELTWEEMDEAQV